MEPRTAPKTKLKIGFDVPYEPYGILVDGRPGGMMVDLVGLLLERSGIEHEFVTLPLADTEPALASGAIDALAFKGITPARRSTMDFSDPLIVSGGAAFVAMGRSTSARLADYAGATVATTRHGPLWPQIRKLQPDIRLVEARDYEHALALVLQGTADMAALNRVVGMVVANRHYRGRFAAPAAPFIALQTAFAVRRGMQAGVLRSVNTQLAAARADGSWQAIHDRWIGA